MAPVETPVAPDSADSPGEEETEDGLEEFVPASEDQVGPRDVLDRLPEPEAASTVRVQILDVIDKEGPVEVSRLARVVARRFGLAVLRTARAEAITSLIPPDRIRRGSSGTFAWPESLNPEEWAGFRIARDGASRRLEEIAPEEICNAMFALIDESEVITTDELIRSTAALFGMFRISAPIRTRMAGVLEKAIADGWIDPANLAE
jgi:hypothetical protein